jgi:Mrp family chromosome partitioning ATPase
VSAEQYVLVGVSRARDQWASDLTRWATSGAAPIEFVQCLTVDEALVVLGTGRRVSALLVTARGPGADRELIDAAATHDVPTIVVADPTVHRDWDALGVAAVVDHDGDPRTLVEALAATTSPVDRTRRQARTRLHRSPGARRGRLLAVMGTGGSGSSTIAMAVAQALAAVEGSDVVLADGARRGDVAMYHHVGDVVPGLPELVDAHRRDRIDPAAVRDLTHPVASRGYSVLLGCRRASDWVTLRRRSVDAALDALQRSFEHVVLDVDADLDGHRSTGSADVEDRHAVTLAAVERSDLVLVSGRSDLHGVHGLARLLDDVLDAGVPPERVLPVVVGTSRASVANARLATDLAELSSRSLDPGARVQPPVLVRRHRDLDGVHDRVAPLPTSICRPFATRVPRLVDQLGARSAAAAPERVRPGELGIDLDDAADARHHVA